MPRGKSKAVQNAMEYLKMYPNTSAMALQIKFEIALNTIYRSDWWKNRHADQKAEASK